MFYLTNPGTQEFTSKNTSVNIKRLPVIFHKLNLRELWLYRLYVNIAPQILDIGCGKETKHIEEFCDMYNIKYRGYDPYWKTAKENSDALNCNPDFIACSNVLNVIKENDIVHEIHKWMRRQQVPYFIKVYEGDKSFIGRETKKGCYQRNLPTEEYIQYNDEIVYKGVLCRKYDKHFFR